MSRRSHDPVSSAPAGDRPFVPADGPRAGSRRHGAESRQPGAEEPSTRVDATTEPSAFVRRNAAFQLWLFNVLVGTVVGSAWLFELPEGLSAWTRVYVGLGLVSSVAVLAALPGALFALAHRFLRSARRVAFVQGAVGNCFLGLLYTDTIIYRLLRYHFNGAVLNVALTPGSGDAVHLGWSVWGTVLVYLVLGTTLQVALWHLLARRLRRLEERGRAPVLLLQPRVVCLAFLLPVIGLEKSVFAAAHAQGDHELITASSPLPIYPRLRLGRLLDPAGGPFQRQQVVPQDVGLAYPAAAPVLPDGGPRPNLLLVVLDSWRRDMFTPELTPHLTAFAAGGARVFEDHLSGGNGTRFGLFTMLYGLHGSYWFQALEERRSPALLDALAAAGYDLRVFSAASMNFPEFLDTAWAGMPREHVVDEFPDEHGRVVARPSWVKDGLVADAFDAWLSARGDDDAHPFFGFVLLDAPHQPYENPGGPYQPAAESLNYIELGRTSDGAELDALRERVFNSYRNSVLHADGTVQRLLDSLERAGALENTVVVVTGDHGEEFHENGFWGHTSNFSPEQVEVPFVVRGPGVAPGRETRPTSHLDVSNSLLELLGADPARRGDYSLGESLFAPCEAPRTRVVAGWSDLGIWTSSGIFHVPLEDADDAWVFDRHWQPLSDGARRFGAERDALERTVAECNRFLRARVDG